MALPEFTMRQLLEAGVHFGHQAHRWNPKMAPYIFGARNGVHILDLAQSVPLLHQALLAVRDVVAAGGRILFVGTKRQASEPIAAAARQSAQYFINQRWLGGTLTNWKTVSNSIKRLHELDELLAGDVEGITKKERLRLTREHAKLDRALGGIKDMGGRPDMLFVIDTNKEAIALKEARKLGIPITAVVDSNCNPDDIDYPIPGNDDASRAITLYCDLVSRAVLDGISQSALEAGTDIGEAAAPVLEPVLASEPAAEEAKAPEAAKQNGDAAPAEVKPTEAAVPDAAPLAASEKGAGDAEKSEAKSAKDAG
ncbi:MAG: 30S ribosomal protein S2 [Alphaproteobacteria bacterium]